MPTSYPLTVQVCERESIWEAGGGALAGPAEARELVDRAGNILVGMAPWAWLEGRQARLRSRPSIDLTGATWTEATKTLTKVGAFANYVWLEADTAEATDGTGVTAGTHEVASRVSADAITLATSIGAAADGQTDIVATLANDQVALPADFDLQRITGWGVIGGLVGALSFVSSQDMLDLRWTRGRWSCSYWALLNHVRSTADGRTIPMIDLSPGTLADSETFVIFYRAGWATPEEDNAPLPLPKSGWLNALFIEVLKAVTHAQEDDAEGPTLMQRIALVKAGPLFHDALMRDQTAQAQIGSLDNGGWTERHRGWRGSWFDRGSFLRPSV